MLNHKISKKSGFSLIEILIVVAIVALLTIIALTARRFQIKKAKDSKIKEDLNRIQTALESYYSDNDCYPDTNPLQNCGGDDLSPYLNSIPCSPYGTPYCYLPEEGESCPQNFRILSNLQNPNDPKIEELNCSGPEGCGYNTECSNQVPQTSNQDYNYGTASTNINLVPVPPGPGNPQPGEDAYICNKGGSCSTADEDRVNECLPDVFYSPLSCRSGEDGECCDFYCTDEEYWCNK